MDYAASLDYLHTLGWELRTGAKFGLDQIAALLTALGEPQRAFAAVHIAGTNGKGSTAALVASALGAAGYRPGLYTSPHLERATERIRVGGAEISPEAFAAALTAVQAGIERLLAGGVLSHPPSFFEALTAAGFWAFRAAAVRIAVVEVGLGGRLDATNVLAPVAAAITAIGMDHERYLGATLAAIAGEKAGILKPGLVAVSAPQAPEAEAVLAAAAARAGARLLPLAALAGTPDMDGEGRFQFTAQYRGQPLALHLGLRGRHQVENARTALGVLEALAARGWPVSAAQAARGFAAVQWPGRLEKVAAAPDIYLDGAHNPAAARVLAAFLADTGWRPVLVFGAMRDKAIGEMAEVLFPRARAVILTATAHPRALSPGALESEVGGNAPQSETAPDLAAALARARVLALEASPAAPILVAGSLYLAGAARSILVPARFG
ncbi:MAG: bifunctional folylpolyglutamate synthase/dihydrofolate synthase [Terriglobales bacterium]